jgi:phosphate transport system permease protein
MTTQARNPQATFQPRSQTEKTLDTGFIWLTRILALAVAGLLLYIAIVVGIRSMPAISKYGLGFLFSSAWNPVNDSYGVLPMIYGTLVSSLVALIIAIPLGLGTAVFLTEDFIPLSVRTPLVFLVELLAAIPSVVYGLWGIAVLVPLLLPVQQWLHNSLGWLPLFSTPPTNRSIFIAGLVLSIMILLIITAISRDSLAALPPELRQASLGLGATRWETLFRVLIPAAFSGIVGGIMLALGRALGETMAATMLIGNSNQISLSILQPGNTIASLLASQFSEASGLQVAALMYAGLVLFVITLIVNILAELVVRQVKKF